jgi:hypothetical protein
LVCFFEELAGAPEAFLKKCFQHIGVSANLYDWNMDFKEPVHRGIPSVIPPNLCSVLEEIYRPKIKSLQEYTGMKLESWC